MIGKRNSKTEKTQNEFSAFVVRVLKNEAKNIKKEYSRLSKKQVTFSDISEQEMQKFFVIDKYPELYETFDVVGYQVQIEDDDLASALKNLPPQKRNIILCSFLLGFSDVEIAELLGYRDSSTVHYHKKTAFAQLKKFMKKSR